MIRDSAVTLRIFERARLSFLPIKPNNCFFDSEGRIKYLGILFDERESSVLASFFSDENKIKEISV